MTMYESYFNQLKNFDWTELDYPGEYNVMFTPAEYVRLSAEAGTDVVKYNMFKAFDNRHWSVNSPIQYCGIVLPVPEFSMFKDLIQRLGKSE